MDASPLGAGSNGDAAGAPARRPRVVYWLNMPAPYFTERLNAVADRGQVEVEAWFNVIRESNRSWDVDASQWRFPARWIPERSLLGWRQHIPIPELREHHPDVFIMEWHRLHLALAFPPALACAQRTVARVLPTWDEVSQRTRWREAGKHWLFRSVDGVKGSRDGGALAVRYGMDPARLSFVPQSIDVDHYATARSVGAGRRAELRERLDLHGCVFIYTGRLIWEKGVPTLLDAFAAIRPQAPDATLLLVGDGVDEPEYRARAERIGNVRFSGFVQRQELPELYACGDVFVFPSLGEPNGLVVDEALAAGLPVISSDAVGDIRDRIRDGENGYVVPGGDAPALAARMRALATEPALRARLANADLSTLAPLRYESYAIAFERFIDRTLATPPRPGLAPAFSRRLGSAMVALGGSAPASAVMAPSTAQTAAATPVEYVAQPRARPSSIPPAGR